MRNVTRWKVLAGSVAVASMVVLAGCSQNSGGSTSGQADAGGTKRSGPEPGNNNGASGGDTASKAASKSVLIVAQSTFSRNEKGRYTTPDSAKLIILRPQGQRMTKEVITDDASNVFHKGMVLDEGGEPAILTIGGDKAALKLWRRGGSGYEAAKTLWAPSFGGRRDRLRDIEIADVTGDGREDLVIATHDQGVVEVIKRTPTGWENMEIDRRADTFVHEIELGDVDGNGTIEIYATPSDPNRGSGGAQGGKVTRYEWDGERFQKQIVGQWEHRHAKEILVADVDGNGRPELYVALEGETEAGGGLGGRLVHPVDIRRLTPGEPRWTDEVVATIPDERQCRFLIAGDLDGDGASELIAAAFTRGIWMFEHGNTLPFSGRMLTRATGGFEHATLLADIDGTTGQELYVADDTHGRLVRFTWVDENLSEPEVLLTRTVPGSAITWTLWVAEYPAPN